MPYITETCSWLELNICYFWIKYMVSFDCISYISLRILLTQNQHWPYSSYSWHDIVKIKLTTAPVPPALSSASFPSNNPWPMWHFVDKKPPQTRITSEAAGMAVCFVHWKKALPNSDSITLVPNEWCVLLVQTCSSPTLKCHSVYRPRNAPNIARKCMEISQGLQGCFMLLHQNQNSHNAEYILTCGIT